MMGNWEWERSGQVQLSTDQQSDSRQPGERTRESFEFSQPEVELGCQFGHWVVGQMHLRWDMGRLTFDIAGEQLPHCQLSSVPCPISNVVVKLPTDPLRNPGSHWKGFSVSTVDN